MTTVRKEQVFTYETMPVTPDNFKKIKKRVLGISNRALKRFNEQYHPDCVRLHFDSYAYRVAKWKCPSGIVFPIGVDHRLPEEMRAEIWKEAHGFLRELLIEKGYTLGDDYDREDCPSRTIFIVEEPELPENYRKAAWN